jgi:4-hydroxybenzoyl-CoA thioesterase/acyl-CoA thioester hydrolase
MTAVFRTTRRVEFADTDMAGIAHFAAFFRWMEAAEHEFLRSRGLSVVLDWEGVPLGFPRVSASCDFVSPVRFEDVLDVEVRLARVGTKSLSYEMVFSLAGAKVAAGKLTAVCCKLETGQGIESVAVPPGVRERLLRGAP